MLEGLATETSEPFVTRGTFTVPGASRLGAYVALADTNGQPVTLDFAGTNSIRLTTTEDLDGAVNFLLFEPVPVPQPPGILEARPAPNAIAVSPATVLRVVLTNGTSPIDLASIRLQLNSRDLTDLGDFEVRSNGWVEVEVHDLLRGPGPPTKWRCK